MNYFYLMTILLTFYCSVQSHNIPCEVRKLPMNKATINIDKNNYWTKYIYFDIESQLIPPVSQASKDHIVHNWMYIADSGKLHSIGLLPTDESTRMLMYHEISEVDSKYMVFRTKHEHRKMTVTKIGNELTYGNIYNDSSNSNKYALTYIGKEGHIRIFQTCNKSFAWIQIQNNVMQHLLRAKIEDPYDIYQDELSHAIKLLKIRGNRTTLPWRRVLYDFHQGLVLVHMLINH